MSDWQTFPNGAVIDAAFVGKRIRSNCVTYQDIRDCKIQGNNNRFVSAHNCKIEGNHNRFTKASDCKTQGNYNTIEEGSGNKMNGNYCVVQQGNDNKVVGNYCKILQGSGNKLVGNYCETNGDRNAIQGSHANANCTETNYIPSGDAAETAQGPTTVLRGNFGNFGRVTCNSSSYSSVSAAKKRGICDIGKIHGQTNNFIHGTQVFHGMVLGRNGIRLGSGEDLFDAMKKQRNGAAASANQSLNLRIKTLKSDGSVPFETLHELLPRGEYNSVTIDNGSISVNGLHIDTYLQQQQDQEAKRQKKEPEQDRHAPATAPVPAPAPASVAAAPAGTGLAPAVKERRDSDKPIVITIDDHANGVQEPKRQQLPVPNPICRLDESDLAHDTKEPEDSKSTCVDCMENTPRTIFLDCMHQALCIKCARSLYAAKRFECIICSKSYNEIRRVFPAGSAN